MEVRTRQPIAFALSGALGLAGAEAARGQPAGLDAPAPVGPFLDGVFPPRTPLAPGSSAWVVEDAFPNLPLTNALVIVPNPSDDRLTVGSIDGVIVSFENDGEVASAEDLSDRVALVSEGGFYGLAFHPE